MTEAELRARAFKHFYEANGGYATDEAKDAMLLLDIIDDLRSSQAASKAANAAAIARLQKERDYAMEMLNVLDNKIDEMRASQAASRAANAAARVALEAIATNTLKDSSRGDAAYREGVNTGLKIAASQARAALSPITPPADEILCPHGSRYSQHCEQCKAAVSADIQLGDDLREATALLAVHATGLTGSAWGDISRKLLRAAERLSPHPDTASYKPAVIEDANPDA